jgi:hypothetical protein
MGSEVSPDDFRSFFLAKSYDVIGQGTFRRHLCKCKEAGDPWAIEMNAGVTKCHSAVRGMQARVAQIPRPRNATLQQLCRDVMVGAQPPIRMFAGYTTCCLSEVSCNACIDLTRPTKNARHVHIHARFSHFFLMLWFCSKLEYVVRSCAKAWMERQDGRDEANFRDMCEAFTSETREFCDQLHLIFTRGLLHVHRTLDVLMQRSLQHRVLEARPEAALKASLDPGLEGACIKASGGQGADGAVPRLGQAPAEPGPGAAVPPGATPQPHPPPAPRAGVTFSAPAGVDPAGGAVRAAHQPG